MAKRLLPVLALGIVCYSSVALAQPNSDLRNRFPGRRVGGGTRAECAARLLAHLVPADSVYAPGSSSFLGLLLGPSANPRPVALEFRSYVVGGSSPQRPLLRELPASSAAVLLFTGPSIKSPIVWESYYQCEDPVAPKDSDHIQIHAGVSPPPTVSLLLSEGVNEDQKLQERFRRLSLLCGGEISTQELLEAFNLQGQLTGQAWPGRLPVRCF